MKLWSDSFVDRQYIPAEFAFGKPDAKSHVALSDNRNPHLAWSDLPEGTRSLALILHDYDVPSKPDDVNQEGKVVPPDLKRVDFFHWVLFDLPRDVDSIAAGSFARGVTAHGKHGPMIPHSPIPGALHGINGYTEWFAGDPEMVGDYYGYDGPCPPWNDSLVHHYVFTLYALSVDRVIVNGRVTGDAVRKSMEGQVLAQAEIVGLYSLNPDLLKEHVLQAGAAS
jgi:Raf kinase inhibitor-like YbhB/YbcL family protein